MDYNEIIFSIRKNPNIIDYNRLKSIIFEEK